MEQIIVHNLKFVIVLFSLCMSVMLDLTIGLVSIEINKSQLKIIFFEKEIKSFQVQMLDKMFVPYDEEHIVL